MTAPRLTSREAPADRPALVRIEDLAMHYPIRGALGRVRGHVHAVNGVDLSITPGEVLGLVGESGSGKTTLGRCIVGVERPTRGHVYYGRADGDVVNLTSLDRQQRRIYQQQIRVIFQDPYTSLNPRMTVLQIVGDPLKATRMASGSELEDRVGSMLSRVGLSPGHMRRYPHAFSGGERQRINIARALIVQPRMVIADEAVSALDVSVRAQILDLMSELQGEFDLTYLFISHDLSVVESLCDRVAVMYLGKIVELAPTSELYTSPRHPYTEALLSAVPLPDPRLRDTGRRIRLSDEFPDPSDPPSGCYFHTRCPYADNARCATEVPELGSVAPPMFRQAACHYSDELELRGV